LFRFGVDGDVSFLVNRMRLHIYQSYLSKIYPNSEVNVD